MFDLVLLGFYQVCEYILFLYMFVSFYTILKQRLKIFWSSTPTNFSYEPPLLGTLDPRRHSRMHYDQGRAGQLFFCRKFFLMYSMCNIEVSGDTTKSLRNHPADTVERMLLKSCLVADEPLQGRSLL
jgi:hypothetical protein